MASKLLIDCSKKLLLNDSSVTSLFCNKGLQASNPAGVAGDLVCNTSDNKVYVYKTAWVEIYDPANPESISILVIDSSQSAGDQPAYQYNGATWVKLALEGDVVTTFAGLTDTAITTPASGNIAIYDGSDSWDNKAVSGDITLAADGTTAIASGVIVNADINASAALDFDKMEALTANVVPVLDASGKVTASAVTATQLGYVDPTSSIQTQLNTKAADADVTKKDGSVAFIADQDMGGNDLTGLPSTPGSASSAASKAYVDAASYDGSFWLQADLASTANLTLSGEQTIDGILTSASRIFVKDQTDATANGVYTTGAGAWTRATDADASAEFTNNKTINVADGTVNAGSTYAYTGADDPTLGSDDLDFTLKSTVSIADGSITEAKLATGSVTVNKIGADAVTAAKINVDVAGAGLTPNATTGALDVNVGFALEINADAVDVKTDGIKDTHIDFGTGAGQVSGVDIPLADAGTYFTTDNVEDGLQELGEKTSNLNILSGVAANESDLGAFTGTTITNDSTIKNALQELETSLELKGSASNLADLTTATGIAAGAEDLGTFTGTTITDNSTVKVALQELETLLESSALGLSDIYTAVGNPNATNMGTYTGSIITDNESAKQNIQELETELANQAAGAGVTMVLKTANINDAISSGTYALIFDSTTSALARTSGNSFSGKEIRGIGPATANTTSLTSSSFANSIVNMLKYDVVTAVTWNNVTHNNCTVVVPNSITASMSNDVEFNRCSLQMTGTHTVSGRLIVEDCNWTVETVALDITNGLILTNTLISNSSNAVTFDNVVAKCSGITGGGAATIDNSLLEQFSFVTGNAAITNCDCYGITITPSVTSTIEFTDSNITNMKTDEVSAGSTITITATTGTHVNVTGLVTDSNIVFDGDGKVTITGSKIDGTVTLASGSSVSVAAIGTDILSTISELGTGCLSALLF